MNNSKTDRRSKPQPDPERQAFNKRLRSALAAGNDAQRAANVRRFGKRKSR